jgi:hypothetical protein
VAFGDGRKYHPGWAEQLAVANLSRFFRAIVRPSNRAAVPAAAAVVLTSLSMLSVPQSADAATRPTRVKSATSTTTTTTLQAGISYGDTLVWMSDDKLARALDDAVDVGAGWVRADLSWDNLENDGPGRYQWKLFDRVVDAANKRGLKVLPVIAYTPPWARPAGCSDFRCGPADPAAFAKFASAAVARYAPKGVHTWEIWNEENIGFWKPTPDPAAYTRLLRAVSPAIRTADRSSKILMGGLAAAKTGTNSIAQADYLTGVLAAGGGKFVDAVAYHPYSYPFLASDRTTWKTPWERIADLRTALGKYGFSQMPVWITETGAPTGGPGGVSDGTPATITEDTSHVTEERQAVIASDVVKTAATQALIPAVFWYGDQDLTMTPDTTENYFGLRRADGSPKPAYAAYSTAVRGLKR